jgi:hypothetical protein
MHDIENNIMDFFQQLINDENHRYKSWEHCFLYFAQDINKIDKEIACLHLSFYLASWGMYRGSSFLLWQDYLIHNQVVEEILKYKYLQKIDFNNFDKNHQNFKDIFELSKFIKNWYPNNIKDIPEKPDKGINVTDTLLTKILLGTLGCIPAYDRFFKDGLKIKNIQPYTKLSEKSFLEVVKFYQKNKDDFLRVQQNIEKKVGVKYPIMKLVDMYFFTLSFTSSNKSLERNI